MGVYDRDYYRDSYSKASWRLGTRSLIFYLIATNVVVWILQCALKFSPAWDPTTYLACDPVDVLERGFVWQLVTANFLHDPGRITHILFNMFMLYFFGREIEQIYGRRDFLIFYIAAGVIAMLAHTGTEYWFGNQAPAIGASGSVMATIFLFGFIFPRREIYLWGLLRMEVWMLCALCAILDIWGALSGMGRTAFTAHLGGAAFGILYRFVDLRWSAIRTGFGLFRRRRRHGRFRVLPGNGLRKKERAPFESRPVEYEELEEMRERDGVSVRIDELLDKISRHGKQSLSDEELDFLKENSQNYRSE